MSPITKTEMLVLNATSDDYENLEQIYRSLALELSAANYDPLNANSFYWREAMDAPPLSAVANAIKHLVSCGLLEGRTENGSLIEMPFESSFVWEGWFRATKLGLRIIQLEQ